MELVSETENFVNNAPRLEVYQDITESNLIRCMDFASNSSPTRFFSLHTFNNFGEYIESSVVPSQQETEPIISNANSNYVFYGNNGRIYNKSTNYDTSTFLNNEGALIDFAISSEGSFIYGINNDATILKYDAINFQLIETIETEHSGNKIFVTETEILIVEVEDNFPETSKIYLHVYSR